ncbi:MAG: hypothetical protein KJ060_08275 [Candidatus Hydrogenedentes bacterium]|nr:hypothetical protein [Candidatus Hydrogenedentota bacterium]
MDERLEAPNEAPSGQPLAPHSTRRRILTWAELLLSAALIGLLAILLLPAVNAAGESRYRTRCQANLKQLGLAFKMFAHESQGERWPALSPVPGNWVPDLRSFYPDYCTDLEIFICPSHPDSATHRFESRESGEQRPDCVSSRYYVYTGFSLRDDYDAVTLHDALTSGDWEVDRDVDVQSPLPYALDLLNGPSGSGVVLWDRLSLDTSQIAHRPFGANVLFMDGHVEFRPYEPENPDPTFPVTSVSAELFGPLPTGLPSECAP